MRIHSLRSADDEYAVLYPVDELDVDRFEPFDGSPMAGEWEEVEMSWSSEDDALPPGDFHIGLGEAPVFSVRALEVLGDLLEGRGELLPLRTTGGEPFYAFNVTRLSDALDEEASQLLQVRRKVLDVLEFEFRPERLAEETIFKLCQIPDMWVLVVDEFCRRVEEAGLTGFEWDEPVWSQP